jgi:phosphoenolpyruvate carboxykinase (ATP)
MNVSKAALSEFGPEKLISSFSDTFEINRERAIDYLNTRDNVYVFDGYAGVSPSTARCFQTLTTMNSGIPSTASRSGSFARVPTMPCSWYVNDNNIGSYPPFFYLKFFVSQNNMLIRPTEAELLEFGEPDFIIYNAGQFPANRFTKGMSSTTSVEINFKRMEMVILGTEYAGEMKKGVFSVMVCTADPFGNLIFY